MELRSLLKFRGPPAAHRMVHPALRQQLREADLLCMQEVWIREAVELFDSLEHAHRIRDSVAGTWWPLTISGSGLGVASRWPIVTHCIRPFRTRGAGTDQFARKGLLHARVRVGEPARGELDVVTTHLQAGASPRSARVRQAQLAELRQALDELSSPERPLLVCGDWNIDGCNAVRAGEYAAAAGLFPDLEDLGAHADEPTMCPRPELNALAHRYWWREPLQRLDYVFFRAPETDWLRVAHVTRNLDQELPAHDGPATLPSDHFGLRVELAWE